MESDPEDQFETAVGTACCCGCFLLIGFAIVLMFVLSALGVPW